MITINNLHKGDIVQYVPHKGTAEGFWNNIGIVLRTNKSARWFELRVYKQSNLCHYIYIEYLRENKEYSRFIILNKSEVNFTVPVIPDSLW